MGLQLEKAASAFRTGALLKAPKSLRQRMPVEDSVIKVVAGQALQVTAEKKTTLDYRGKPSEKFFSLLI